MTAELSDEALIRRAVAARERAYAPYSGFRVGAAVATEDGRVYVGANVENASYGLTVCAERVALWTAIVDGAAGIRRVVVAADTDAPVSPCGACRQVLLELAPEAEVVMATLGGEVARSTVADLLPAAFGAADLETGAGGPPGRHGSP